MVLQKKNNNTIWLHTLITFIFLIDETVFPVFHFSGIPFKVSYVLLLFSLLFYLFNIRVNDDLRFTVRKSTPARTVIYLLASLIALSCLGELTMQMFSDVADFQPFPDAILNYLFMMAAFILGYAVYRYKKNILLYVLYLYCLINIGLLMFYDALPSFVTKMYGEYYASGIRIRGTGGNANTTLLVMNMVLMSIVILFKLKKLEIRGIHVWLVLIVPILTNFFVTSRGEFVGTVLLELMYLMLLLKNEPDKAKTVGRIVVIVGLLVGAYVFVFHYLYNVNENIRYGIDRLTLIGSSTDLEGRDSGDANSFLRPFLRADVFWKRFKYSPVWGAGYSYGTEEDFIKSADGYHNDWFRVLASTGIAGFCCWFAIVKKFVKKAGVMMLLPFLIAGLTNTFLRSTHALNVYFFLAGAVLHLALADDDEAKETAENRV